MHEITEQYKTRVKEFEGFRNKIDHLIEDLLVQHKIHFNSVDSRVKDIHRLEEKILRKEGKYLDLLQITDLVGVRIITFFEDEVDKVARIIDEEFSKDVDNSIDKRVLDTDRFGYRSLHYVVCLSPDRSKLTEYKHFKGFKVEIQIRSILQHAWAEIEHDIGYKGVHSVPDALKRNFSRVAALLETADIEFVKIKNEIKAYEAEVKKRISSHPEDVEVNAASLRAYIFAQSVSSQIDHEIITSTERILDDPHMSSIDDLVEKLHFLHIKSIKAVDAILSTNRDVVVGFAKKWLRPTKEKKHVERGIGIFYLVYVLIAEKTDPESIITFVDKFYKRSRNNYLSNQILETYQEVKACSPG